MRKRFLTAVSAVAVLAGLTAGSAMAAGPPERAEDPFVCPVLTVSEQAVENSGKFNSIGEDEYTFGPGAAGNPETFNGNVPNIATNGDGTGVPPGPRSSPGDTDYTAIWSGNEVEEEG